MNKYSITKGRKEIVELSDHACFSNVFGLYAGGYMVNFHCRKHKDADNESEWYLNFLKDSLGEYFKTKKTKETKTSYNGWIFRVPLDGDNPDRALTILTFLRYLDHNELNNCNVLALLKAAYKLRDKAEPFHALILAHLLSKDSLNGHYVYSPRGAPYSARLKIISIEQLKKNLDNKKLSSVFSKVGGDVITAIDFKKYCDILDKDIKAGYELFLQ